MSSRCLSSFSRAASCLASSRFVTEERAHFQKGADDKHAYRHGVSAVEDIRSHDGTVLSEGIRAVFPMEAPAGF
jgi:hypothetical protein